MTYELAQRSQPSRMWCSLNAFSKYNGESALDTFVTMFVNEASLCCITDEYADDEYADEDIPITHDWEGIDITR